MVASEKGVVVGRLVFQEDGDTIDCQRMGVGGKAIPPNIDKARKRLGESACENIEGLPTAVIAHPLPGHASSPTPSPAMRHAPPPPRPCIIPPTPPASASKPSTSLGLQVSNFQSDAKFVLLVEKDAAFMRLAEDRFYNTHPCIIITAKGQPDVATRQALQGWAVCGGAPPATRGSAAPGSSTQRPSPGMWQAVSAEAEDGAQDPRPRSGGL